MGIKRSMNNLAQLLLMVIVIPIIIVACYILEPGKNGSAFYDIFVNIFSFVPIVDVAVDVLSQFISGMSASEYIDITFSLILRKFPEAVLLTMIVHFCNECYGFLWRRIKPLPIISTFIGVIITAVVVKAFGLVGNNLVAFFMEIGTIIIMIIGMKILFKSFTGEKIFSLFKILLLVVDGLFAVIITTYFASCYMAGTGRFDSIIKLFGFLFIQTLVACGAALIVMFVRIAAEGEK